MKKIFYCILIFLLMFSNAHPIKANTIKITMFVGKVTATVNGNLVFLDVPVIISKECNRTLVPLRFISEVFGAHVEWRPEKKEVKITLNNKEITLFVGKKISYVNNEIVYMDCAPKILFSRTIVPIRFISEVFGATVKWYGKEKKIDIIFEPPEENTEPDKAIKVNPDAVSLSKKTVHLSSKEDITFYIAKIDLKEKNIGITPILAKEGPKTREEYSSFINRTKPIIAINGGTFDLKTNILTGDVVKNGIPQYIRYDGYEYTETMGINSKNMPFYEDGKINYSIKIDNTEIPLLSVNGFPRHLYNAKVKLFTSWYKNRVEAKEGEKIIVVKNGIVKNILNTIYPSTLSDDEYALLINSNISIEKDDAVKIKIAINGKDYSGSSFVRCGPLLIKEGKAYINYTKYATLNRTMKKSARSLIGIGKDKNFYFIYTPNPVSLNYGSLSIALEKCGIFEYVISLDGGSSTLFYYKGKYIAKPVRRIINIIAVPSEIRK